MNDNLKSKDQLLEEIKELRQHIQELKQVLSTSDQIKIEKERKLREQEETFRGLFNDTADAIYVQDVDGRFLDVNSGAEKMYGYSRDEMIGKTPEFVSAPGKNDLNKIKQAITLAFNGTPQQFEFWGRDKSGRIFPKEVRLNKGTYFGEDVIIAFARDITKKLKYELKRRQNEERLYSLYEHAPIGIVYVDPETFKFKSTNQNFCQFIGYSSEELANLSFLDFTHPEERETDRRHIKKLLNGEIEKFDRVKRYVTKNGEIVWGKLTVSLIHNDEGKPLYMIAAIDDTTQQKEMEREKESLRDSLQQTKKMEALATLAGGVAHDFNNALTSVIGNLELLEMALQDDNSVQRFTNPIFESTSRMAQLTNQLLAYAQGGKYQPKAISLDAFINSNISLFKHQLPAQATINLDLQCKDKTIFADSTQLLMILSAAISNAAEAIDEGGAIHIKTALKKFDQPITPEYPDIVPATYIHLCIEDDGHGMDEATLERIFEPFFTTKLRGRGLGMASVYGIVKNHDGYVYVHSKKNAGTTLEIFLPLHIENESLQETPHAEDEISGTVLIIEDEDYVKNVIVAMLQSLGYSFLVATCGKAALEIVRTASTPIDIILLDMGLPDIPGQALFDHLRKYRPNAKIILCSGYSIDGPAQELLEKGADAFLQKPFNFVTLSKTLKKVMLKETID